MPTYVCVQTTCWQKLQKTAALIHKEKGQYCKKECYIEEEKNINKNRACHMATANATVKVRLLFTYCMYNISGSETRHIPLRLLQL